MYFFPHSRSIGERGYVDLAPIKDLLKFCYIEKASKCKKGLVKVPRTTKANLTISDILEIFYLRKTRVNSNLLIVL